MSLHLFKHLNGQFLKKNKKMAGDWTVCFTFRNKFFFFFKFPSSKWQPMQIAAKENERGGWERTPPVTWSFDIFVARRPSTFFFFSKVTTWQMIKSAPFLLQEEISFDGHETEAIPRPSIRCNSARIDRITLTTWGFADLFYSFLFTTKLKWHPTLNNVLRP